MISYMDANSQITNFVLNIACWQVTNQGYTHKISMHIQDVVPGFVITSLIVDNGELSFEGIDIDEKGRAISKHETIRKASELTPEQLDEILKIIKSINLFEP